MVRDNKYAIKSAKPSTQHNYACTITIYCNCIIPLVEYLLMIMRSSISCTFNKKLPYTERLRPAQWSSPQHSNTTPSWYYPRLCEFLVTLWENLWWWWSWSYSMWFLLLLFLSYHIVDCSLFTIYCSLSICPNTRLWSDVLFAVLVFNVVLLVLTLSSFSSYSLPLSLSYSPSRSAVLVLLTVWEGQQCWWGNK